MVVDISWVQLGRGGWWDGFRLFWLVVVDIFWLVVNIFWLVVGRGGSWWMVVGGGIVQSNAIRICLIVFYLSIQFSTCLTSKYSIKMNK